MGKQEQESIVSAANNQTNMCSYYCALCVYNMHTPVRTSKELIKTDSPKYYHFLIV